MLKCKTVPYSYQDIGTQLLVENLCFALLDDMGTGKTKTFIDAACGLRYEQKLDAALVVCPNSLKNNWGNEEYGQIVTHGWDDLDHTVYTIRSGKKLMPLTEFDPTDMIWVMVNYESVWRNKTETWLRQFMQRFRTAMVLDESQRIKNPTSAQSKGCIRLGQYAKRRYIMTGTPVTKSPLDYWAQFRFLDETIIGHRYFNTFRLRYAKMIEQVVPNNSKAKFTKYGKPQPKTHTIQVVDGYQRMEELLEKVGPYYRRVEKKDCLDLPDKVYMRREVELNKEQVAAYKAMADKLVIELEGVRVKAPIALTKILRLLQITSGYVTQDGNSYTLGESPKLAEIITVAEEHNGQLIIFFRENLERLMLQEAFTKKKIGYAVIYGGVPEHMRTELQQDFQRTSKYKIMLANVAVGGIGLDLTAADLVLYNSNSHSLEHRWQSEDRAHRIGQSKKVTYMDFLATLPGPIMTLDHTVLRALEMKVNLADLVVKNVDNLAAFFKGLTG
jgi:SNF2 family DNA or RNA helicase